MKCKHAVAALSVKLGHKQEIFESLIGRDCLVGSVCSQLWRLVLEGCLVNALSIDCKKIYRYVMAGEDNRGECGRALVECQSCAV
jgi:hypothetical protein